MFRPCIDLHDGKVKQIVGKSLESDNIETNFVSQKNAAYYAELFKKHSLKGGHIIMLGKGNENEALSALKAYPFGMQIGGGINISNASFYLDEGASHIIITSWIFENNEISYEKLKELKNKIGKNRLVIDLSCKKHNNEYYVVTNRWKTLTKTFINKEIILSLSDYCDEFLIHAVDVEGSKKGIDIKLVEMLSSYDTLPITYAGGSNSINDLETIFNIGKGKIFLTIGSALDIFGGSSVNFMDAVNFNNSKVFLKNE